MNKFATFIIRKPNFLLANCCKRVIAHDVTKYHVPKPRQASIAAVSRQLITTCVRANLSNKSCQLITTCVQANLSNKCSSQYRVLFRVQQHNIMQEPFEFRTLYSSVWVSLGRSFETRAPKAKNERGEFPLPLP